MSVPYGPPTRILIVDDDPDRLRALEAALAPLGAAVVKARSGPEALKRVLVEDFACILLAARLPGLDGAETATYLQSLERTRDVPLLLLEARPGPREPEDVAARVRALLDRPASPPAPDFQRLFEQSPDASIVQRAAALTTRHVEMEQELLRRGQELQAANQELREREERFQAVLAALAEGITLRDARGGLMLANQSAERLLGLTREQMEGRTSSDPRWGAIHEDGRPFPSAESPPLVALRTGTSVSDVVLGIHRPDGRLLWLSVNARPLFGPDGRTPTGVVSSFFDITERKQVEEEEQRRAHFEQHLMGIVSHDLRNPLNAILLSALRLLRQDDLSERQAQGVARIRSSAERATRMIRDLLDFTQARVGGGIPIERRPVDLHDVVRGVLDEVEAAHPGREVWMRREGDGHGTWDGDRLAQVAQNLVTNALKYSPAGTPVRVETRREEEWVVLSVQNEGVPIPLERLGLLFEPFERATVDADKASRSVGLGLYIVRHIVDAHGGTIDVRSTAAEGTTFTVRLPPGLECESPPPDLPERAVAAREDVFGVLSAL